jgi:hypothetical protein
MIAATLQRAREELGMTGLAAAVVFAGAALFLFLVLKPLEARKEALEAQLARAPASQGRTSPGARLGAFYQHFETRESATDWLARLNAVAVSSGVQIRSTDYRMTKTGTRIERYELVLPLSGSYPQIRAFLRTALADIPVLSLDQITVKRERAEGGAVQAEARMTLHLVRP